MATPKLTEERRAEGTGMHELSVCGAIADAVLERAGGRRVVSVQLQVGHLRQLVPASLEFCWSILSEGGALAGSTLDIDHVPAVIECGECGRRTQLDTPLMVCPGCSSGLVEVVAGREFLITSIELQDEGEDGPTDPGHPEEG